MLFLLKNYFQELYELIAENIESILIDKAEIEEKINENLIKFQNDERLIQMRERMKVMFKEPNIPEYHSSSSIESDDDDDDNSQVGDDNEKSYGTQTDSVEEDEKGVSKSKDELMKDENAECCEKKMKRKRGLSKKMNLITIKKKGWQIQRLKIKK
ncbi:hypothetical protein Tco_1487178 [Tanacetum coccineum]